MITATRPTPLAALEPGQVIRPGLDWPEGGSGAPVQMPDLVVSEKRQTAEGWTVFGKPVVSERRRRLTAKYAPGQTANVVAKPDDLDAIRNALGWVLSGQVTGTAPVVKVLDHTDTGLTIEVDGWVVDL